MMQTEYNNIYEALGETKLNYFRLKWQNKMHLVPKKYILHDMPPLRVKGGQMVEYEYCLFNANAEK